MRNPLLNAERYDAAGEGEEAEVPEDIFYRIRHENRKALFQRFRVARKHAVRERPDEVRHAPAADHGIVGKNDEGRDHADKTGDREEGASHLLHRLNSGTPAGPADRGLSHQESNTDRKGEDDVGNDEISAAIRARPEGEFPDCAEADG